MSSVQNPTYLLAPNWDFRPGGPIALGNIVADPFRPHKVLSRAAGPLPLTETILHADWSLRTGSARSVHASIWAVFFDAVGVDLLAARSQATVDNYSMRELETTYFVDDPPTEDIVKRIKDDPKVSKLMRLDSVFCRPVYMITGIKTAKGFMLRSERSANVIVDGAVSAPVAAGGPSVGGGAGVSAETSLAHGLTSPQDIVFAYQLLKISPRGWNKKTFKLSEYQSKATFLSDDATEEVVPIVVEITHATSNDFVDAGSVKSTCVVAGTAIVTPGDREA
ncbi:hypothetical protein B0T24DRAFT_74185 [Lasiosphaeria ovina]|uniref:Uncharacterized protein n=1 Tax=Lasiosphaeria ovina TaxID=92902 RepID=A0AAE0TYG4_9PEZI|nr:hypothetical protein B0T24DRAFT_74185 [Lasiosphaeria ovina]